MTDTKTIKVGLLGLGTVGTGVYKLIGRRSEEMQQKTGAALEIKKILVHNMKKVRQGVDQNLLTDQWKEIIEDDEIQIVIEVMGGIEPAKTMITEALKAGEVVELDSANTIADGTAVKEVGDQNLPYVQENVDDILLVEDDELIGAFLDMVENHKMIVENSGLLSVAALKQLDCKGKKVVCVLSGGNMDVITMSSIVQHGLIQRDRIFSVSVLLPDKPGELARVAETIANVQGNIIKLEHNQFVSTNRNAAVELRITMEAFGTDHKKKILEALDENGFRPKTISAKLY